MSRLKHGLLRRWLAESLWQHGGRFWTALWRAGKLRRPVRRNDTERLETLLDALPTDEAPR
jgi:hypothetical protein